LPIDIERIVWFRIESHPQIEAGQIIHYQFRNDTDRAFRVECHLRLSVEGKPVFVVIHETLGPGLSDPTRHLPGDGVNAGECSKEESR
jgi:hypothetical protein